MAKIRVGINGFGRIGRNFLRAQLEQRRRLRDRGRERPRRREDDGAPAQARLGARARSTCRSRRATDAIRVGGHEIKLLSERDPADLPWGDLGVDVAIESTGLFTNRPDAEKHLQAGAKKVVISAPATDPDITHRPRRQRPRVRPGAAPHRLERLLHDELRRAGREGAPRGVRDRARLHDDDPRVHERPADARPPAQGPAPRPRRRDQPRSRPRPAPPARSASCCPTSRARSTACRCARRCRPARSSTSSCRSGAEPTAEEVNELFRSQADTGDLEGILQYTDEPIVSTDIVHSSYSSIFDSGLTMANGNLVKVFSWYDNEWGYSCRLVDLVAKIGQTLPAAVAA